MAITCELLLFLTSSAWKKPDKSITNYNRYSCPIPKRKEAKLYLVIADTQTRVFLASKMTEGYFGVYPTKSCTTVFKRYTLILPDPDTYLFLLFTILTSHGFCWEYYERLTLSKQVWNPHKMTFTKLLPGDRRKEVLEHVTTISLVMRSPHL
jgi:hypothetical protein